MLSPGSCQSCRQPLAVESDCGLCELCQLLLETSGELLTSTSRQGVVESTLNPECSSVPTRTLFGTGTGVEAEEAAIGRVPSSPAGYELLRQLGRGGMGEVYLAREYASDRVVAMKFLRGPADTHSLVRFLTEIKALARLDHSNIVRVFAVDTNRSDPMFTMEYAAGGTLASRVKQNRFLPPREAAEIIAIVSRAVHAAHGADVLHRDLKPSNILLTRDGIPKVSDFGLAKRTDVDDGLTQGSGPIGTPAFMPPEQVSSRFGELGPAADVYGLGATLYHLLTGRPPFEGDRPDEILSKVSSETPDRPKSVRPDLPLDLEGIVVKCLEKNPKSRYASAEALAEDLDRFLEGDPDNPPIAPPLTPLRRVRRWAARNRRRLARAATALFAAVALVGIGSMMAPAPSPEPDPLEELQQQLAAGQSATLIPETGFPRWQRFWFFPSTLGLSPQGDGTCSFQSQDLSLLELLPDPGIDRYRIRADIRHLSSTGERPPGAWQGLESIGFYFGCDAQRSADGRDVLAMLNIHFNDFTPDPPAVKAEKGGNAKAPQNLPGMLQKVRFQPYLVLLAGLNRKYGPGQHQGAGTSLRFKPTKTRPGPWRFITVDVAPEAISVHWQATEQDKPELLAHWTVDEIQARMLGLQPTLGQAAPGSSVQVRPWSPRRAVGVWCFRSGIAVRNVVIEPLP